MGLPNYLFKKHKITYYQKSWQHTLFFISLSLILIFVYQIPFFAYFHSLSIYSLLIVLSLFLLWLFTPVLYKNDYYTKQERFGYQVPKFFEILFQQLCFLGGLLTFGFSPAMFRVVFFIVHLPMFFFVSKKFALVPIIGSLVGGLVIASLQSLGIIGFFISLFIHLLFWTTIHYFLSGKNFFGIVPVKR
jgi:hypothetical protein